MDPQLALYLDATRATLDLAALCDEDERAIARALRWGRAGARQVRDISAEAGTTGRRTQEIVDHLIHVHRWPIGTSMSEPFGNYLIDTAADLEQTVELLRTRGISSLARAAALKRITVGEYLRSIQHDLHLTSA